MSWAKQDLLGILVKVRRIQRGIRLLAESDLGPVSSEDRRKALALLARSRADLDRIVSVLEREEER
jgi:hypothetical protein